MLGSSNKSIANGLAITEAIVKVHLKSILRKIRAQNRTQAAIWAMTHLGNAPHEAEAPIALQMQVNGSNGAHQAT